VSFLTIGVIWLNHHRVFDQVARVDGPLLLVATVVLSFAAALGVSALVFDHVFKFAGADPAFPLWTFVFLVALGTDYNIFLMTRVHEEAKVHGTRRGR
jgi:RND superfamily putative drug exporter